MLLRGWCGLRSSLVCRERRCHRAASTHLADINLSGHVLLIPPVVIAVALETSPLCRPCALTALPVTSAAGLNSGNIDVRSLLTLRDGVVAASALHHAVRLMIEFCVRKPSHGNNRLHIGGKLVPAPLGNDVTQLAVFLPQESLCRSGALAHPFLDAELWPRHDILRRDQPLLKRLQVVVQRSQEIRLNSLRRQRRRIGSNDLRICSDKLGQRLHNEVVDLFWLAMRRRSCNQGIELQRVAGRTLVHVSNRRHVGAGARFYTAPFPLLGIG